MAAIKDRDTKPEMIVRRALHAAGLRFRLHQRGLPGRPDIVLPRYKTAIFVHGCFWHNHSCDYFVWPKTRADFWREKILGNVARDKINRRCLTRSGWRVLVVWECDLSQRKLNRLVERVRATG